MQRHSETNVSNRSLLDAVRGGKQTGRDDDEGFESAASSGGASTGGSGGSSGSAAPTNTRDSGSGALTDDAVSVLKRKQSILETSLSSSERAQALISTVLIPYIRCKLETRYEELADEAEDLRDAGAAEPLPVQRLDLPPLPPPPFQVNRVRMQERRGSERPSNAQLLFQALQQVVSITNWKTSPKYAITCLHYFLTNSIRFLQNRADWLILNYYPTFHMAYEFMNLLLQLNSLAGVGVYFSLDQLIAKQALRRLTIFDIMTLSQPDFEGYSAMRRAAHMLMANAQARSSTGTGTDPATPSELMQTVWDSSITGSASNGLLGALFAPIRALRKGLTAKLVQIQRYISQGLNVATGSLKWLIFGTLVAVQVYEWWLMSAARGQNVGRIQAAFNRPAPIPPPPPPFVIPGEGAETENKADTNVVKVPLPRDPAICALCHKPWVNPAATPTGYVYCYTCLFNFINAYGTCPVTGVPCQVSHIRKIYPE